MWIYLCVIILLIIIIIFLFKFALNCMNKAVVKLNKYNKSMEFYFVLVRWLEIKQDKKSFNQYFIKRGYKTVAVYGMKELGILLCRELNDAGIEVLYTLDKNAEKIDLDINIPVIAPTEKIPEVDVIVVTAIHYFEEIYRNLVDITDADIVSIEDVLKGI